MSKHAFNLILLITLDRLASCSDHDHQNINEKYLINNKLHFIILIFNIQMK